VKRRTLWILIGILVVISACCTCGGLGALGLVFTSRPPEDVDLEVQVPETVTVGDPFLIRVTARNTGDQNHTLHSVIFPETLLQKMAVLEITPAPVESDEFADITTYLLQAPIAPHEEAQLSITLVPKEPGLHISTLDVCIDSSTRCVTFRFTITVRE